MGTVYRRGRKLWVGYKDRSGRWTYRSTGLHAGQEREARAALDRIEERVAAQTDFEPLATGPITVAVFAERWVARRRRIGLREAHNDWARLRLHVLPRLGAMPITDVRVRHVRDLFHELRAQGRLAPRTIHSVYGTLHVMFRDAVIEELVDHTPCVLTRDQLGPKLDKDPEWRANAVFGREELELLISDPQVPPDRQVVNALKGLAGLRQGEVAGLRWRDLDAAARPLGRLVVARSYDNPRTKTGATRRVPVHPTLATVLEEWRTVGFPQLVGREPRPDDPVVPSRLGRLRSRHQDRNKFLDDLKRLGLRRRRGHDLRRTFITLARVDGARKDILEMITHNPKADILDVYTSLPWPSLCEEVAKLKVRRLTPEEAPARLRLTTPVTTAVHAGRDWVGNSWKSHVFSRTKKVEAPGVEPGSGKGWCAASTRVVRDGNRRRVAHGQAPGGGGRVGVR